MRQEKCSYADIANNITAQFGVERGVSARSVRRFCAENVVPKRNALTTQQLQVEVASAINEAGPTYGRKMLTGYLAAKGVHAAERRVGSILENLCQPYNAERYNGARNLNPSPYYAKYMGHKLHIDQNEKLVMFGVTHVLAIDGFSSMIVAHSTMPVKNNVIIYDQVFRSAVMKYGMWDQVRVDHGKEFYLTLFMQEMLQEHRHDREAAPYCQTQSTRNHTVERMWPEVNNRVNYPLKTALVGMTNAEILDMEDSISKYCVSKLTCQLAQIGITRIVASWNAHRIPRKGIPSVLSRGGCQAIAPVNQLLDASAAADLYQQHLGSLTRESTFGADPFPSADVRSRPEMDFNDQFPDMEALFEATVHRNYRHFQEAVMCLIDVTKRYVEH
ncbi:uncharacterized protein [Osmerus mordax]|uniref:uncharacterized protein n=1 Tax=Osmerus mordax TaxID=8014 RepID=UPI00350FF221